MPRRPRIDFPGAWHHVMHRGARRAPIFTDDSHCHLFIECLAGAVGEFELDLHAYSLMPNHYHLLIRSRHGNLSSAMRRLNATYTQRLNVVRRWDGPVFRGRFHSQPVVDEARLPYVLAYIHMNPLRANLVTRLQSECWTSHRAYIGSDDVPPWLTVGYFRELLGGATGVHDYVLALHRKRQEWPDDMSLDTGWIAGGDGGEPSRARKTSAATTRFLPPHEALALVVDVTGAGLKQLRAAPMGPRANPARRFAVWALKQRTSMTHEEIGRVLRMSPGQVAHVLRRLRLDVEPFGGWLARWEDGYVSSGGS